MSDGYSGVPGAFPFAFRASDSRLFRSYLLVGSAVAALMTVIFLAGLVNVMAATAGAGGGSLTLSRTFVVVVALFVVGPLIAPVLLVARRHRLDYGRPGYDRGLAAAGYLFVVALYLGVVATIPPELQQPASGALAPVVRALYAADPALGAVLPVAAAATILLVHRQYR